MKELLQKWAELEPERCRFDPPWDEEDEPNEYSYLVMYDGIFVSTGSRRAAWRTYRSTYFAGFGEALRYCVKYVFQIHKG